MSSPPSSLFTPVPPLSSATLSSSSSTAPLATPTTTATATATAASSSTTAPASSAPFDYSTSSPIIRRFSHAVNPQIPAPTQPAPHPESTHPAHRSSLPSPRKRRAPSPESALPKSLFTAALPNPLEGLENLPPPVADTMSRPPFKDPDPQPTATGTAADLADVADPRAVSDATPASLHAKFWSEKQSSFNVQSWLASIRYVNRDTQRQMRAVLVGLFAVFLVVTFVMVMQNALSKLSMVFLKLSEDSTGEIDAIIVPKLTNDSALPFYNGSYVQQVLADHPDLVGAALRWPIPIKSAYGNSTATFQTLLVGIDSTYEQNIMHLGRTWELPPLNSGECWVFDNMFANYGVAEQIGGTVNIVISSSGLVQTLNALNFPITSAELQAMLSSLIMTQLVAASNGGNSNAASTIPPDTCIIPLTNISLAGVNNTNDLLTQLQAARDSVDSQLAANATDAVVNGTTGALAGANNTTLTPAQLRQLRGSLNTLIGIITVLNSTTPPLTTSPPNPPGNGSSSSSPTTTSPALDALLTQLQNAALNATNGTNTTPCLSYAQVETLVATALFPQLFSGNFTVRLPFTVVGIVTGNEGKFPSLVSDGVVVDTRDLVPRLVAVLLQSIVDSGGALLAGATGRQLLRNVQTLGTTFNLREYALTTHLQMRNRVALYVDPSGTLDRIQERTLAMTDAVFNALGQSFPVSMTTPVLYALESLQFFRFLIEQVAYTVVAVLVLLGVILIYSLLQGSVNTKSYEFGILRSMGLQNGSLFEIIFLQTGYFAVPGVALGILACFLLGIPITVLLAGYARLSHSNPPESALLNSTYTIPNPQQWDSNLNSSSSLLLGSSSGGGVGSITFTSVPLADYWYTYTYSILGASTATGLIIGLLVPLLTVVIPVRRALSRSLRAALSLYETTAGQVSVTMVRLAELGLAPWQTALSFVLIVMGFLIYYMVPYSFFYKNFAAFFGILSAVLMAMLIGLVIMSILVFAFCDRAVLRALLFLTPDRRLYSLICKNQTAHRPRGQKTALMYTLSLAFIIYMGCTAGLLGASLSDTVEIFGGTDLIVTASSLDRPLDESSLRAFLDLQRERGLVAGYSFVSFPMSRLDYVARTKISTLSKFKALEVSVYAVDAEYTQSTYEKYFVVTESAKEFSFQNVQSAAGPMSDVVRGLYDFAGNSTLFPSVNSSVASAPILAGGGLDSANLKLGYDSYIDSVVSEASRLAISTNTKTALTIKVEFENSSDVTYLMRAVGMLKKAPGFLFSQYRIAARGSPVFITRDNYKKLLAANNPSVTMDSVVNMALERCLVRLPANVTDASKEIVSKGLFTVIDTENTEISDTQDTIRTTKDTVNFMLLFFNIVGGIAGILAFFILLLSTAENILENKWEFGVLRAIGLNKLQLQKCFIYEGLSLIVTSILFGTAIGLATGFSSTATMNIFLELPFRLILPYTLYFTEVGIALFVGFFGSYLPSRSIRNSEVANVLRDA